MTTHPITPPNSDTGEDRDQKLLTITEAAALLRTPVGSLRFWRSRGIGPHSFRLGRRVFYRYTDLIDWIDQQHDHNGPHAA